MDYIRVIQLCILFITITIFGSYVIFNFQDISSINSLRRLSATYDINTNEYIKTINGTIPEVSCPLGHYRPAGSTKLIRVSGQRQDGCYACPKGRYGDTTGLKNYKCSGLCPIGTYGDHVGLTSKEDCKPCPPGTFSKKRGEISSDCSGKCPYGYFSDTYGAKSCKPCPPNYFMWQCPKTITSSNSQ